MNIEQRGSGVLVASDTEPPPKAIQDGGRHSDGSLTLSPEAARHLMGKITHRGSGIMMPAQYFEDWFDEMSKLLEAQGLSWEAKT